MLHPRDAVDRQHELAPRTALGREHLPPLAREAVVAAAPLAGLLHPPPLDPAAPLELVEERVERGHVEPEHAAGAGLDQLAQLVAVPRLVLEQRQDHQLRAPLLQLGVEHGRRPATLYMVMP